MGDSARIAEMTREVLDYDPETGVFRWKKNRRRVKAGAVAGKHNTSGHVQIRIGGKQYLAHRLAWLLHYGRWPTHETDHINCIKDDNRLCNLRDATRTQNLANKPAPKHNTSGIKGVSWHKRQRQWVAGIRVGGRKQYLGGFDDINLARAAYEAAAKQHFGEFYRP